MQRIFIWGTGFIANQVLNQCSIYEQYEVLGFIDNDSDKRGTFFRGSKISPPDILYKIKPDKIVVLTNCYDEIKQQIIRMIPEMQPLIENKNYFYKQSIIRRYAETDNPEINKVLKYIKNNDLQIFNYDFVNEYKNQKIDVIYDSNCGMYYVYHQNKKLYFAKSLDSKLKVEKYYRGLLIEQDQESPHRYLTPEFNVNEGGGDIVVDVGAAEGNFSLEIIERVSKVYMIETDDEWIEALKETFKNYQEKVVIVQKFITSTDEGKYATLDQLIEEPVDFIKIDVEGNEWDALLGAKELVNRSKNLKCAVCSYHADFDEVLIKDVLTNYGLTCSTTPGYMWYPCMIRQTYISTRLCKGIVRGIKC